MKNPRDMMIDFTAGIKSAMKKYRVVFQAFKKRRVVMLAMIAICVAILATGTLAYFTAEETAYNVITTGILSMDLVEETTGGKPFPSGEISGIVPGMEVDKIPYVVNNGGVEFYARMRIEMRVTGADGKLLSDEYVSLNFDRESWMEKDGYFYYNEAVKPGEKTKPLFTKVTFDTDMHNAYMNAKVEIDVYAQVVQSKNNSGSALTAGGWTESN